MATLGCAEEYEAVIVNSRSQLPLLYLPWSSINWQRTKNEVSVASVTVAQANGGIECCGVIGGLFPWAEMLRIERNGEVVWDGPITGWSTQSGSKDLTIRALDRSAIFFKRLVNARRTFTSVTPYSVFVQMMTDALIGNITYDPYPITVLTATPPAELTTRDYFVERLERLYDVFKELTASTATGFWTTSGENVYLDELTIARLLGKAYTGKAPKISDATTLGPPGIDVDGLDMATYVYAGGSGQGVNGFPLIQNNSGNLNIFLSSKLEKASAEDRAAVTADLSLIAGRGAALALAPATTIEKIRLSPDFGSEFMLANLSNLLPGAQFDVDYEDTCSMLVPVSEYREAVGVPGVAYASSIPALRMDQLDVAVRRSEGSGIEETVEASCRPILYAVDIAQATGDQTATVVGQDAPVVVPGSPTGKPWWETVPERTRTPDGSGGTQ